jgi:hypothetical protein
MNIKSLYKYVWGVSLSLLVASCTLDEYNPAAVSEETELNNFDGWKSYQASCYSGLFGALIGMQYGLVSELGTDLWTFPYGNHHSYKNLTAYEELTNSVGVINNVWVYAWGSIKDCNKTIQTAAKLTDGDANDIAVLTAEAHFLRAYYYSVLVAQFGEVPLVLVDEPVKNLNPKRSSIPLLYAQIVADLRHAFNNLPVTPYEGNAQRVTKKAALGILARVYAQGAGEGLSEGGKGYWVRAKEVADSLINDQNTYGATLYADFAEVFAAANNRNNAEALFTAYGRNPYNNDAYIAYAGGNTNLYLHYYPKFDDAFGTADVFKRSVNSNTSNAYYGRCNQQVVAPTKYLVDRFNAQYDKRWEHTFVSAFTNYSGEQALASLAGNPPAPAKVTYADATVELTADWCAKYGIDPSHAGKKIYPYADVNARNASAGATWQYIPKVWNKGAYDGNVANLTEVPNANVHPYPLAADEDRFFCYLSKETLTPAEKQERAYITVNLNDLFDASDPTGSTYKTVTTTNGLAAASLANLFPAMQKFNHNFDGGWVGGNFQTKVGNVMVMRMAEVYLIAAEAAANTGATGAIAGYLQPLRNRAERLSGDAASMGYASASIDDVLDEYARELCGEFNRWAILKRNKAFEARLQKYNNTAYVNFDASKHYKRPIPQAFLSQIENADEFGTNGY